MSRVSSYDLIVVGAGPAGAHLALRMARAGFSVALLDRKRFPRPKACGEFLSPECAPLLAELGLYEPVVAAGAWPVAGMDLHGYGRHARGGFVPVGPYAAPLEHGLAVRREVLDAIAVRAAAARTEVHLAEGHTVTGVLRDADGAVTGVTVMDSEGEPGELRARYTVGADGTRSAIARALDLWRPVPWLRRFALVTRYAEIELGPRAEVHFFPRGYFAATPVDSGLFSVNLVVDEDHLRASPLPAAEYFAAQLRHVPAFAEKLARGRRGEAVRGIGPMACTTTTPVFAGGALVGDACGYVDPVTGEGLFFAMRGAELLAGELATALHAGRTGPRALEGYRRARRREFGPRLTMARLLQRGLRSGLVTKTFLGLLQRRPRLADLLVSVTGDYAPPRALLAPKVWWPALTSCAGSVAGA